MLLKLPIGVWKFVQAMHDKRAEDYRAVSKSWVRDKCLKIKFHPHQRNRILGFTPNSDDMSIALPKSKRRKTLADCKDLANNPTPTIRKVARVVGKRQNDSISVKTRGF